MVSKLLLLSFRSEKQWNPNWWHIALETEEGGQRVGGCPRLHSKNKSKSMLGLGYSSVVEHLSSRH